MLRKISEPSLAIEAADIEAFEGENDVILPEDYKNFLLKFYGGVPEPDTFPIKGHREKVSSVAAFLGLRDDIESVELQWALDAHREKFEDPIFDQLFPIAYDSFNDSICLDLSEEHYGRVVFIDMVPMWKDHTAKDIYVIADNFDAFLEMLYEPEDLD